LYGEHPVSLRPPHLKPDEPFVVLVGNVMPSLNDYVASPLYGQVAGVYLHANALANLSEKGQHYIRQSDQRGLIFLCLSVLVLFWMWQRGTLGWKVQQRITAEAENDLVIIKVFKALGLTVISMLLITLSYSACYVLNVAPEGWMSLSALIPFLWEAIVSNEPNYHKEVPHEKAISDPLAPAC
jgi:CHASE2 domain-containing sensor protein